MSEGAAPVVAPPLRRDLRLIVVDGVLFSAMVGLGETYLAPFALALGMSEVLVGLVATLPMIAGGLLQMVAPSAVGWARSIRAWTAGLVALQASAFVPLVIAALVGAAPAGLVFAAASIYWGAGMAAHPGWNAWMIALVPGPVRSRFFARRQSAAQLGVLSGLVCGGLVLEAARRAGHAMGGFTAIFAAAFAFRAASSFTLGRHSLPASGVRPASIGVAEMFRRAWRSDRRAVVLCLVSISAAVNLAGPFFTPYLLVECRLSYGQFMFQLACFFGSKIVSYRVLGRFVRGLDLKVLLAFGGLGMTPLPLLWLGSREPLYFAAVQLVSGLSWAAFELGTLLSFLDVEDERERTSLLVVYNALNALGIATGSLIGGAVLILGHHDAATYRALFVACAIARLVALAALLYRARHAVIRMVPSIRTLAVRPWGGGVVTAVLGTLRLRRPDPPADD